MSPSRRVIQCVSPLVKEMGPNKLARAIGSLDVTGAGTDFPLASVGPFILLDVAQTVEGAPKFGQHPHHGHSVITYPTSGSITAWDAHGDEEEEIKTGGAYWVDAGKGVVHSEVTKSETASLLQLWVNVKKEQRARPAARQLVDTLPSYRLEGVDGNGGAIVTVVLGSSGGEKSPIETPNDVLFLHAKQEGHTTARVPIPPHFSGFVLNYVHNHVKESAGIFGGELCDSFSVLVLDEGKEGGAEYLEVTTSDKTAEYMLIAGEDLGESWVKLLAHNGAIISDTEASAKVVLADIDALREKDAFTDFGK